ncbi:hypothetical protein MPLA_320021 [Mesorhizobium sp. ORS 3359]|nr:hypothetical protein MPLA_320021 [Mesorhizobium sp. ORS 3359]
MRRVDVIVDGSFDARLAALHSNGEMRVFFFGLFLALRVAGHRIILPDCPVRPIVFNLDMVPCDSEFWTIGWLFTHLDRLRTYFRVRGALPVR